MEQTPLLVINNSTSPHSNEPNTETYLAGSEKAERRQPPSTIGYVLLDSFSNEDDLIPVLTDQDTARTIARRRYVLIEETGERTNKYFAQIMKGPLHTPEWGSASEGQNVFPIVKGDEIEYVPSYHSYYLAKVLGEIVELADAASNTSVRILQTAFTRPMPKSRVSYIEQDDLYGYLSLVSDKTPVGILANYGTAMPVPFYISDRLVNRQLGVFGSTGSGKSNTVIVLAETLLERGWSVVIFDHSGEYYKMTEPSAELGLFSAVWRALGIEPRGIGAEKFVRFLPAMDGRSDLKAIRFGIASKDIPFALIKALMSPLTDAQDRVISGIHRDLRQQSRYDGLKSLLVAVKDIPDAPKTPNAAQGDLRYMSKPALTAKLDALADMKIFDASVDTSGPGQPSDLWREQTKTVAAGKAVDLSAAALIKPGRLAVIDLGNVGDQDVINIIGLAVLDMLERSKNKIGSAYKDTKVAVFLEEAHTFFSDEHAGRPEFAQALTRVTKRIFKIGRKFWLNPVVISQQPADIPAGIMSQCVMRITHQLSDERDIAIVGKGSAKQFVDIIPDLRKGECLVTTPEILAPQVVRIRPAMAKKVDPQNDNG